MGIQGTPLVSIIVPAFNAERTICKCIDSIFHQTLKEIEVIVVNDGSHDRTREILLDYRNRYEKLKIINKNNEGVSAARNNGMKEAKGKYIAFIDADDYISKTFCEKMVAASKLDLPEDGGISVDVVVCDYTTSLLCFRKYNQMLVGRPLANKSEIERLLLLPLLKGESDYIQIYKCTNKLYRRAFIENNHIRFPNDIRHGEDHVFVTRTFRFANYVTFVGESLYTYRRFLRMETATTSERLDAYAETLKWRRHLEEIASQYPIGSKIYESSISTPLEKIQRAENHIKALFQASDPEKAKPFIRQIFEDETYHYGLAMVDTSLMNPLQRQEKEAVDNNDYEFWLHVMHRIVEKQPKKQYSLVQKVRRIISLWG